jgi:glycosyltransferase involved in cell wall biosynthesis
VHVVPPGIDLEQWKPVERGLDRRPRLLFVGADFERKGGPLLLDVYRRYLRDETDLHLVTRAVLPSEPGVFVHNDLGVGDPRLRELYQTSDMLVLPTMADCFSIAALEAMACGLPVVISRTGGIPEIVIDGETGMLVAPGKADSLLRALRVMLTSPDVRRRMGEDGRRRVERHFDARVQAATTVGIMSEAAS